MTVKQVADEKNVTVGRVYQLITEGTLKAEKLGSVTLIRRAEADKVKIYGKAGRPPKEKESGK